MGTGITQNPTGVNPNQGSGGVVTGGGGNPYPLPLPGGGGSIPVPEPPVPPSAPLGFITYTVQANRVVQFYGTSIGAVSLWTWNFGDGTPQSTAINPIHQYASGVNNPVVTLTVKAGNLSSQNQVTVSLGVVIVPQASFVATSSGLAVGCVNTSNFTPTGTSWDFGDGTTGIGNNTVHVYSSPGTYTITMTSNGLKASNPVTVAVASGAMVPILWTEFVYSRPTYYSLGITNNLVESGHSVPGTNIGSAKSQQQIQQSGLGFGVIGGLSTGGFHGAGGMWFGLANSDPGLTPANFAYVVEQTGTTLNIYEPSGGILGSPVYVYTGWSSGTNYVSITINGSGKIQYAVGTFTIVGGNITGLGASAVIYTSTSIPTFPMIAAAVLSVGTGPYFYGILDTFISGGTLVDIPVASFSYAVGGTPETINFTDTSEFEDSTTTWTWNFGDGTTSTLQSPTHVFPTQTNPLNTYPVTLTVTNSLGSESTTQQIPVIIPATPATTSIFPPIASFTCTYLFGTNPLTNSFTDTSTNNPTAWIWKDNGVQFSTSQNPTGHSMATGTHIIQLTVSDSLGRSSTATASVVVAASDSNPADSAPGVDIASTVYSGVAPVSVTLSATVSTPVTYSWVSSDGQNSTASSPTFVYKIPGTYTITLTATDTNGSTTATIQIYVASTISIVFGDEYTYAIDNPNDRVLMYNFSGVPEGSFGTSGANAGQLNNPTKLDVVKIFEEF